MSIKITLASKTFLLGDYISLLGGPVLVLNTEPRFQCALEKLSADNLPSYAGIHRDSPAGKFIQKFASDFAGHDLTFFDPHQGAGGFGASSAQFVMVYTLRDYLLGRGAQGFPSPLAGEGAPSAQVGDVELFLDTYQNLAKSNSGLPPSGADCIAQMQGGLCYFHRAAGRLETLSWPFPDLDFCLLHTGHKLSTHEHLQEISLDIIPFQDLEPLVFSAYAALRAANAADFIAALSEYAELQKKAGLLAMSTQDLLPSIRSKKGVLLAKGCGALGADVVMVLLQRAHSLAFISSIQRQGLRVVALGNQAI